jgi:antitoxin component of RelBE/YafQ-DinJ toxin-antitoxin module
MIQRYNLHVNQVINLLLNHRISPQCNRLPNLHIDPLCSLPCDHRCNLHVSQVINLLLNRLISLQ